MTLRLIFTYTIALAISASVIGHAAKETAEDHRQTHLSERRKHRVARLMEVMTSLESQPDSLDPILRASRAFRTLRKREQVLHLSRRAYQLANDDPAAREAYAFALLPIDRFEAFELLAQVLKDSPRNHKEFFFFEHLAKRAIRPLDKLMAMMQLSEYRSCPVNQIMVDASMELGRLDITLDALRKKLDSLEGRKKRGKWQWADEFAEIGSRAMDAWAWEIASHSYRKAEECLSEAIEVNRQKARRLEHEKRVVDVRFGMPPPSHRILMCGELPCSLEVVNRVDGGVFIVRRTDQLELVSTPVAVRTDIRSLAEQEVAELAPLIEVLRQQSSRIFYVDSLKVSEAKQVILRLGLLSQGGVEVGIFVHPRMNPKPPPELVKLIEAYVEIVGDEAAKSQLPDSLHFPWRRPPLKRR